MVACMYMLPVIITTYSKTSTVTGLPDSSKTVLRALVTCWSLQLDLHYQGQMARQGRLHFRMYSAGVLTTTQRLHGIVTHGDIRVYAYIIMLQVCCCKTQSQFLITASYMVPLDTTRY